MTVQQALEILNKCDPYAKVYFGFDSENPITETYSVNSILQINEYSDDAEGEYEREQVIFRG